MKFKALRNFLFFGLGLTLLTGCTTVFQDFTPERIPQNPSGIYTFSFSASLPTSTRIEGSERAFIVINGETYPMVRSDKDALTFYYDYKMPLGVTEARYYYYVEWEYTGSGGKARSAVRYSTHQDDRVYTARLINRYPIQLVNDRGPAGARIPIVGNGFSSQDVVLLGGQEAATTIHSPNSLDFTVPALPAGQRYQVQLRTGSGDLNAGLFRVDEAAFSVQPTQLYLVSGQSDFLIVQLDSPAPMGGLFVDARTDVPNSLIMPEIIVPEGARSVNVTVTGGDPGVGVLQLEVPGFSQLQVPVTVE
jgi:hypothetical protein